MRLSLCLIVPFVAMLGACSPLRKTLYFNDAPSRPGDSSMQAGIVQTFESIIQADDILAINVTSISSITVEKDPVTIFREGGTLYNVTASPGGQSSLSGASGYLVDPSGNIDYPVVGKLQVSGLTIAQTKNLLSQRLKLYVKDPIVEVRIINYKVTVLGEVNRPGVVLAPNHRISIIEALAAAGDIPISGKRDNVLVAREVNGRRQFARVDLSSVNAFNSPYWYLKQNDIVYVEASQVRRQESSNFVRIYLPIITTLISTAAIIYSVTRTR